MGGVGGGWGMRKEETTERTTIDHRRSALRRWLRRHRPPLQPHQSPRSARPGELAARRPGTIRRVLALRWAQTLIVDANCG